MKLPALLCAALIMCGSAAAYVFASDRDVTLSACESLESSAFQTCVQDALIAMLADHTTEDVFQQLRSERSERPELSDCYLIAHRIGEAVVRNDPADWPAHLSTDPSNGMCSGGYLYGIAAAVESSVILEETQVVRNACAEGSFVQRIGCAKAIGSAFHHAASADISRAFDSCDRGALLGVIGSVDAASWRSACYEGVVHDAFMPLDPSVAADPSLHGLTAETADAFCHEFGTAERRDACKLGVWPLHAETLISAEAIQSYCQSFSVDRQESCVAKLYRVLGWRYPDRMDAIARICNEAGTSAVRCLAEAAKEFARNDGMASALLLCGYARAELRDACVTDVLDLARNFSANGSTERIRMCRDVPPELRERCVL